MLARVIDWMMEAGIRRFIVVVGDHAGLARLPNRDGGCAAESRTISGGAVSALCSGQYYF